MSIIPPLLRSRAWPQSTVTALALDQSKLTEEERTPYYDTKRFYPAYLGELLAGRYQLATKLGYGTSSTVWLARDLYQWALPLYPSLAVSRQLTCIPRWRWLPERYVAIKINAANRQEKRSAENELLISQIISRTDRQHHGWHFVRKLIDDFRLVGPSGADHICLVFEPLREPLWILKDRYEGGCIPSTLLKIMLQMILHGLDYLHRSCRVTHTGKRGATTLVDLCSINELTTYLTIRPQTRQYHGQIWKRIPFSKICP